MPRTGRPRKSDAQKMQEGTYRKDRANNSVSPAQELTTIPDPPDKLSVHAKTLWKNLVNELIVGVKIAFLDIYQVEILVCMIDDYWKYRDWIAEVDKEKFWKMKSDKQNKYKFLKDQINKLEGNIRKYATDFGMNPQSRRSLLIKPTEEKTDAILELIG